MLATRGSKIYFRVKIHKNLWLHQTVVSLKIKSGQKFFIFNLNNIMFKEKYTIMTLEATKEVERDKTSLLT
jgi:hypothetical protein